MACIALQSKDIMVKKPLTEHHYKIKVYPLEEGMHAAGKSSIFPDQCLGEKLG
jgi:hypothetical protein